MRLGWPRVGTAPALFPRIMGDNLEFLRALIPEVMGNGFFSWSLNTTITMALKRLGHLLALSQQKTIPSVFFVIVNAIIISTNDFFYALFGSKPE